MNVYFKTQFLQYDINQIYLILNQQGQHWSNKKMYTDKKSGKNIENNNSIKQKDLGCLKDQETESLRFG